MKILNVRIPSIIGTYSRYENSKLNSRVIFGQVIPKFAEVKTKSFILETKIGFYGVILQYLMNDLLKLVL